MQIAVTVVVALVALFHVWVAVLEMLFWTKPIGLKTFRKTPEFAKQSAPLAANQGLYNGFLAAGLVWSLLAAEPQAHSLKIFFLGCVVVAGIFAGFTVAMRIAYVQATPAAIGLALVLFT